MKKQPVQNKTTKSETNYNRFAIVHFIKLMRDLFMKLKRQECSHEHVVEQEEAVRFILTINNETQRYNINKIVGKITTCSCGLKKYYTSVKGNFIEVDSVDEIHKRSVLN